jgi:hypothetical protein
MDCIVHYVIERLANRGDLVLLLLLQKRVICTLYTLLPNDRIFVQQLQLPSSVQGPEGGVHSHRI